MRWQPLALIVLCGLTAPARADELIDAPGADLVRAHCSGCHSLQLVTAQRGDREFWVHAIRWMQRTQNLWQLPPDQEVVILDYLAEHYAESEWGRRPNLSPLLLPSAVVAQ